MEKKFIGATWNKWDLHFHTPSSYDYKNKSVSNQEIIDELVAKEIKVIAITDHHVIDIQRINELKELGKGKITVLPGIEFLSDARGEEPIHFISIFPEDCNLEHIWGQIRNRTDISKITSENKKHNEIYCHLFDTISLIKELGGIVTIHAGKKSNGIENITHALPHSIAQKEDIAKVIHVFELGNNNDIFGYETKVIPYLQNKIQKEIPLIICSDNHNIKDYVFKQNLWIKAAPTFEGLKQILFEPRTRIAITENEPTKPLRSIESLKLKFPAETKILHIEDKENNGTESIFCLGKATEINFSPYFTCIVGGRGTGKSTILSLIAQKAKGDTNFFKSNFLRVDSNTIKAEDYIDLEGTIDIEFISQNQVEKYASNEELTEAIYDRLVHLEYQKFTELETQNKQTRKDIEEHIKNINEVYEIEQNIIELKKTLSDSQKIVNHYSSPKYKELTEEIARAASKKQEVLNSKSRYFALRQKMAELLDEFSINKSVENEYEVELNNITNLLRRGLLDKSFLLVEKTIIDLGDLVRTKGEELDSYMKSQGVSEEDASEYERAIERIPLIETEIIEKQKRLFDLGRKIDIFNNQQNKIELSKISFEEKLNLSLKPLNAQLKTVDKNVADIRFEYRFNIELAINNLFDEFEMHFKEFRPSEHSTRKDAVRDYLFCVSPWEIDNYDAYIYKLEKHGSNANAKGLVKKIFEKKVNFETYKLLIRKIKNDIFTHKSIVGFYGNKELKNCSFGQKCTAVIVALLTFGTKPIIIDEPEAHLDSKLIAEYLVKLIKEKKKTRQIIFATHNANFVINGDAELIHCLDIDETNLTKITSMSIEDLKNRDRLLALEGGKEAFELRDKKLLK